MEASKFQSTQAPLKALYREDPKAAFLTLKAQGVPGENTVTCNVETGRGLALAGIHPKAGGSGLELCSGDMLLEALIACAGISLKAAATMLDIPIRSAAVFAEGDVDLRGTLGVAEDVRPAMRRAVTAGHAFGLATLATLYPAWRAARTQPAEALRYE